MQEAVPCLSLAQTTYVLATILFVPLYKWQVEDDYHTDLPSTD
jgi:hypothetical protein